MMSENQSTRRQFLVITASTAIISAAPWLVDPLAAAIREVVGGAVVHTGKVKLEVPPLVENGNTVPITISVASPMTEADYVKSIHVFNEKNPLPNVGNFHLGVRSGRAAISTRIRLADSQKIVVIAKLSDGSFWSTTADVVVTLAACTEDVI
jgi:sulfur-oxidizing protein SoxY